MTPLARPFLIACLALALGAPSALGQGPDYVASDNVEFVMHLKETGDGVGGKVVGNTLYITSTTHLTVYDITSPGAPKMLGLFTLDVEWENEEVPTNGKILGISASLAGANCATPSVGGGGCLNLYDVSNPASVKLIKSVMDAGEHTHACILDCTYFIGDGGKIVDARDPKNAKFLEENWVKAVEERYPDVERKNTCHHVREIANGVFLGSCNPVILLSVLPEHGGSVTNPALLATGEEATSTLVHSSRFPRLGRDKFLLVGQETNASPQCDDTVAAFQTFDATKVLKPTGGWNFGSSFTLVDEFRPTNGTYVDGKNPVNGLGCSVHWFQEHPSFKNGGVVAVASYENGTRFLQIENSGKIIEQGFFQPLAGSTSSPLWAPDGKHLYNVDYTRGVDVLRWTGETYVPAGTGDDFVPIPGAKPGTGGVPQDTPACASAAGFRSATATGAGKKVTFGVERREQRPFVVDVFQQSQGSKVVKERLVARFANKTAGFTWNGVDRKKRKLKDGNYFVRFTMKLASGAKDVRRATLTRFKAKFKVAPDYYQRIDCGIFRMLKLTSSVFGGRTKEKLGIAYKLEVPAKDVKIEVKVGSKVKKTFTGGGTQNKTFRFSVPASIAKKGQLVSVTVTPDRGGQATATTTLIAKRI